MVTQLAPFTAVNTQNLVTRSVPRVDLNFDQVETNIELLRDAVNALCVAVNDLTTRVGVLEGRDSGSPTVTNFVITAPARVDVSTDLSENEYSATYDLFASALITTARIVGFESLPAVSAEVVIVADAVRAEGSNTQSWTFPTNADFSVSGNQYTVRLELYTAGQVPGTDTPAVFADQTIIAQAAPRTDMLYWGLLGQDNTPANVNVTTLQSQTRLDGDVTLPTFTDNQYVVFAYPNTAQPVTGLSFNGGFDQLPAFTATPSGITVDGVPYTTLISDNLLVGQTSGVDIFSGATATITR